jgi:ubiquinone/menaquinone biosynthesis C-methylase UbiE
MTNTDVQFVGSIPTNYERYLVPLIFDPYAKDLAKRISKLKPQRILETAAGTGVVTSAIVNDLTTFESLVATDLNPAMLAVAQKAVTNLKVTFQQADATALPFADGSFDLVACQFGVMFFPDKLMGFQEAYRVLRKGGTFLFNVWDVLELNDIAALVNATVAKMFPDNPSMFMARVPHGFNNIEAITTSLKTAGFSSIGAEKLAKRSKARSAHEPAMGFCQGTPMRSEIESRNSAMLAHATDLSEQAIALKFGKGPIDAGIQAIVFTAMRP